MTSIYFDLGCYTIPHKLWLNGQWASSSSQEVHKLTSAVNDQVICEDVHWATAGDIERAVESATNGLKVWQALDKNNRRDALRAYANLIRESAEELFWLEAILVGKARSFFMYEIDACVDTLNYFANLLDDERGSLLSHEAGALRYTNRQPYGVCAAILPYNAPLVCCGMKMAPALAAGNALIVKASELNPLSTLLVVSLATRAGIPPGIINCVTGDGSTGNTLASHMRIQKISFTGSLKTARLVQIAAAQSNLKSVTLGLGGKSPTIVFPDADLDNAAQHCCQFLMLNGQGCMLSTTVFIHETIFDEILGRIKASVQLYEQNLGSDPRDATTWSSPLFNHHQKDIVLKHIENTKKLGNVSVIGGGSIFEKGCYVRPALVINPEPTSTIAKEEIFGPVLVLFTFRDEDEVIGLANESEYGLGAFVWTRDLGRALRTSGRLEAGCVGVNGVPHIPWEPNTPVSGWKQSGQGSENGREAMLDWSRTKSVKIQGTNTKAFSGEKSG